MPTQREVDALTQRNQHLQEQLQAAKDQGETLERELRESRDVIEKLNHERTSGRGTGPSPGGAALIGTVLERSWAMKGKGLRLLVRVKGETIVDVVNPKLFDPRPEEGRPEAATAEAAPANNAAGEGTTAPKTEPVADPPPAEHEATAEKPFPVKPGDSVLVSPQDLKILGPGPAQPLLGAICLVKRIIDGRDSVEVDHAGQSIVVALGQHGHVEVGDRVVLDQGHAVVLANLGKGDRSFFQPGETSKTFDDIGGQEEAKAALMQAIVHPTKKAKLFARFKKKRGKGVVLAGPPGCGKTLLGKAVATEVARQQGQEKGQFFYVSATELLEKWVGNTEANIRALFALGGIVFLDEGDALLRRRGSGVSSDMEATVVPTFLAEMDGMKENGTYMIIATNRPDILDPAVTRDGRVNRVIYVGRPSKEVSRDIFGIHLRELPLKGITVDELKTLGAERCFDAEAYPLYHVKLNVETGHEDHVFGLANVMSGAMIEGIVGKAVSVAIDRCIEAGDDEGTDEGITRADFEKAIEMTANDQRHLDHREAIDDYARDKNGRVIGIERFRQSAA